MTLVYNILFKKNRQLTYNLKRGNNFTTNRGRINILMKRIKIITRCSQTNLIDLVRLFLSKHSEPSFYFLALIVFRVLRFVYFHLVQDNYGACSSVAFNLQSFGIFFFVSLYVQELTVESQMLFFLDQIIQSRESCLTSHESVGYRKPVLSSALLHVWKIVNLIKICLCRQFIWNTCSICENTENPLKLFQVS